MRLPSPLWGTLGARANSRCAGGGDWGGGVSVWLTFRGLLRRRWSAWLGLALLLAVVAGGVMGAVAGARRTDSAGERFREAHHAYDVLIGISCARPADGGLSLPISPARCLEEVRRLPSVADAALVEALSGFIATADGTSVQPFADDACYSGPGRVDVLGDRTGRFGNELNETRIVAGRRADPEAVDEAVLSKSTADRLGIEPGSVLQVSLFDGDECFEPSRWSPPISVRVVGIGLAPGEVPPPSGDYSSSLLVTPAFLSEHAAAPSYFVAMPVRLRNGADRAELLADIERAGGHAQVFIDARDLSESLGRGIRPQAVTLWLVAGLAALAGAAVVGQALVRQSRADAIDRPTLTAIGMSRRGHLAVGLVAGASVGAAAGVLAVVVALAASTLTPVGLAGVIEPDPGVSVDVAVLGIGMVTTVGFVLAVTAVCAWWPSRVGERGRSLRRRPVPVVDGMAHVGFPTTMVAGVRMALQRGAGRAAVPVGTSIAAIAVATVATIGSLTFGAGVDHLIATPRLIGLNWDGLLLRPDVDPDLLETALTEHRDVIASTAGTFFAPFPAAEDTEGNLQLGPERRDVAVLSFANTTDIGPSVIAGRAPTADDEVLIAPETLAELGLAIGDTVDGYGQVDPMPLRIVGVGVIPSSGGEGRLGRGATLTLAGLTRLNSDVSSDGFWLRFAEGADHEATLRDVLATAGAPAIGQGSDYLPAGVFGTALELRDVAQVDRAPRLFAAVMAAMALGVIVHVLVTALHANRRDLAVLRAIGWRRGDVRRAMAWQATVYVLSALALGVPLGIALGRSIWRLYAQRLGVVPEPVVPWLSVAAAVVAPLVLAVVIALTLSRRTTAKRTADALTTE